MDSALASGASGAGSTPARRTLTNESVDFSRSGRFFNAKGLSHFRRLRNSPVGASAPGRAQTSSPSECFRVRIPENAQAALAKTSIRSKYRQIHFK